MKDLQQKVKDSDALQQQALATLEKVEDYEILQQTNAHLQQQVKDDDARQQSNASPQLANATLGGAPNATVLPQGNDFDMLRQTNASLQQLNAALEQNNARLQQQAKDFDSLQQTVATWQTKMEGYRLLDGYGAFVFQVKHDELTGKMPFVPRFPENPTWLYSDDQVVREYTMRLFVATESHAPENQDYFGVYLDIEGAAFPCKVQHTYELAHHDRLPASAVNLTSESTYSEAQALGFSDFIAKARLASPDNNPYVKDGYVTFKCTLKIVDGRS